MKNSAGKAFFGYYQRQIHDQNISFDHSIVEHVSKNTTIVKVVLFILCVRLQCCSKFDNQIEFSSFRRKQSINTYKKELTPKRTNMLIAYQGELLCRVIISHSNETGSHWICENERKQRIKNHIIEKKIFNPPWNAIPTLNNTGGRQHHKLTPKSPKHLFSRAGSFFKGLVLKEKGFLATPTIFCLLETCFDTYFPKNRVQSISQLFRSMIRF